jgi:hypothetical protein
MALEIMQHKAKYLAGQYLLRFLIFFLSVLCSECSVKTEGRLEFMKICGPAMAGQS